jgi:hypothetical protein
VTLTRSRYTLYRGYRIPHSERFPWQAAFTAALFFLFIYCVCLAFLYCVEYVHIYTHIWLRRDGIWITATTKQYCRETFLHKSGAVQSVDWICHWGAGLAVTGRVRDIGQNVLQSSFQTGSSSSPSDFRIFFLIAFLEEAFIRNTITIPRINYLIIICINDDAVVNNKTPRPYLALRYSHRHAKEFLRNLQTIWARAPRKVRWPWLCCYACTNIFPPTTNASCSKGPCGPTQTKISRYR